jgi:hypothetical protein
LGVFPFDASANGLSNKVANDIFRCIVNAVGLSNLGFGLKLGASGRSDNDVAEKPLINAAKYVNGNSIEIIGRVDVR